MIDKTLTDTDQEQSVAAGERIKRLRSFRGMTCAELAEKIGCTRPYLSAVENGRYPVSNKILKKLSSTLNVSADFFVAEEEPELADTEPVPERAERDDDFAPTLGRMRTIPIISVSAAGRPLEAFDDYPVGTGDDYVVCPKDIHDENAFALKIMGDSMDPVIPDHSTIVVAPNMLPREGRPVVAKLYNDEVTCKVYRKRNDSIILSPYNAQHDVQVYGVRDIKWIYPVMKVVVDLYR